MRVPVVANGDIATPEQGARCAAATGADAIMIGRAAQGRPWIFREIAHFLATGAHLAPPLVAEVQRLLLEHLQDHYALYGEYTGVRSARKHIGWYVQDAARRRGLPGAHEHDGGQRHADAGGARDSSMNWAAGWTGCPPTCARTREEALEAGA